MQALSLTIGCEYWWNDDSLSMLGEEFAFRSDMEMKDFASALAHDMLRNDFDSLTSEVRVLIIDRGRGEMQSMMSSLGGGSMMLEAVAALLTGAVVDSMSLRKGSTATAGGGEELIAVATRGREIGKYSRRVGAHRGNG